MTQESREEVEVTRLVARAIDKEAAERAAALKERISTLIFNAVDDAIKKNILMSGGQEYRALIPKLRDAIDAFEQQAMARQRSQVVKDIVKREAPGDGK